jgi:hypothetical protein
MAAVVDLVANLIYFSEEIKKSVEEEKTHTKSFAKTAYKGVTRGN